MWQKKIIERTTIHFYNHLKVDKNFSMETLSEEFKPIALDFKSEEFTPMSLKIYKIRILIETFRMISLSTFSSERDNQRLFHQRNTCKTIIVNLDIDRITQKIVFEKVEWQCREKSAKLAFLTILFNQDSTSDKVNKFHDIKN